MAKSSNQPAPTIHVHRLLVPGMPARGDTEMAGPEPRRDQPPPARGLRLGRAAQLPDAAEGGRRLMSLLTRPLFQRLGSR
jgi:hypothetical protein